LCDTIAAGADACITITKTHGKHAEQFPERWLFTTWIIVPESFNEENHLLNSTIKMVCGKIIDHFATELDFLYTPEAKNIFNDYNLNAVGKWNGK
jgi:long-chain acyl-CoA synthetase